MTDDPGPRWGGNAPTERTGAMAVSGRARQPPLSPVAYPRAARAGPFNV